MQVILREDVANLGQTGELVSVKDGYGRNYLIPKGLAVLATPRNKRRLEHDRKVIEQRDAKRSRDALTLKAGIEKLSVTIAKQTGEEGKLFGSVTTKEISEALAEEGFEVDRKTVVVDEPIKSLGVYTLHVKLTRDVIADLKLWVVAK